MDLVEWTCLMTERQSSPFWRLTSCPRMRLSFAPLSLASVRCNAVLRLFFGFSDEFREASHNNGVQDSPLVRLMSINNPIKFTDHT